MRANERLAIIGKQVILVPYEKAHVPRYHEWMRSPFLQEMTGSEPLSIDEEYAMQQSWRKDDDKCTFIVLAKEPLDSSESSDIYDNSRMIGDVNFYLNNTENQHEAELEVMIAEQKSTGKGIGTEVLKLMMEYAVNDIKVTDFVARIKDTNASSIHIFEKKLGFEESERSPVFKEVTLRRKVDNTLRAAINQWTAYATRVEYKI
ncbi:n-acetyltransferase 9-like protein [Coemansia reversa NRRL 1564]|uniref:N-acetyltransferase 9-like protein n=1 Tax=Coemansia reversa (strain ATCC 12441 / NRRL 1564) TaxID=763665 RepID=A0A2G5BGI9_COERN|nr:n-acetyltransferase 9-like protein [Coemansia reversa NRRL 1564]|eukprot:PIA18148.1 n-acetyltransferase 9-like protein [Coemansia reversa NRRL 1564]